MSKLSTHLVTAALAGVVAAGPAAPQQPTERFGESIEVRILDLEVVVVDKDGQRVTGLTAGEFEVRIDGHPAEIVSFGEVEEPSRGGEAEGGGAPIATLPRPVNFLVFIDDDVTLSNRRDIVLENLRRELSSLRPGDRVAVLAFYANRLQVLCEWTESPAQIDRSLTAALARPSRGIKWVALRRQPDYIANWEGNATRRSVLAAAGAMRTMEAPPGRKALLLVAGGWDPLELNRSDDFSRWCVTGDCGGVRVLDVLIDTANQLGYSIFAADVEGRDPDDNWSREKRLEAALELLAETTGGVALYNGDRRRLLSQASTESRAFYSLAVTAPAEAEDGRHRIEVTVARTDLSVRTRSSFVEQPPQRARELDLLGSLFLREDAASPTLPLHIGAARRRPEGRMSLPVSASIPATELTWVADGSGFTARFEILFVSVDVRGNSSEIGRRSVVRRRSEPPPSGSSEVWTFELDLRRRGHTVAIAVRDVADGRMLKGLSTFERRDLVAAH